jgi:Fic family protein
MLTTYIESCKIKLQGKVKKGKKIMTKREVITAMLNDVNVVANADYKAYLENELNLVIKKNTYKSTKPTKNQIENEKLKDTILETLKANEKPMTATEISTSIGVSVNKASALLTQLKEDNAVVREVIKRKAYFSIA